MIPLMPSPGQAENGVDALLGQPLDQTFGSNLSHAGGLPVIRSPNRPWGAQPSASRRFQ